MFLSHRSSCLRLTDQLSQRDVFLGDLGELDFHALRGVVTSIRAGRSDKPRATSTLRATARPAWICSLSFASHGSVRSGPSAAVLQLLGGPVQWWRRRCVPAPWTSADRPDQRWLGYSDRCREGRTRGLLLRNDHRVGASSAACCW